jgi:hypothetical protein
MPVDSDPILISRRAPDDLTAIILDISSHIQYKFLVLLLLIFIIASSDVFINRILANFKGAVDYKCPTSWGVVLQGIFIVLSMAIIDGLIRQKII